MRFHLEEIQSFLDMSAKLKAIKVLLSNKTFLINNPLCGLNFVKKVVHITDFQYLKAITTKP